LLRCSLNDSKSRHVRIRSLRASFARSINGLHGSVLIVHLREQMRSAARRIT
jgi:hypothetical protein